MRIEYLREYMELVYCRNFSKAAKNLHTTQSSLSKHVIALEETCGARLLDRRNAQVYPTEAGAVFFEAAQSVVQAYDHALEKIEALEQHESISVGGLFRRSAVMAGINAAADKVRENGMLLSLHFDSAEQAPYVDMVLNGALDLVITMLGSDYLLPEGVESRHLFDDPLLAVVGATHPLAGRSSISVTDLNGQTVLNPTGSYSITGADIAARLLSKYQVEHRQKTVFLADVMDLPLVKVGNGVLIAEQSLVSSQNFADNYVAIPFDEADMAFPFDIVFRADSKNPALVPFVEALVAAI